MTSNLTGSANFFKYILFIINLCLVITGIIILSIGATVQGVYHGYYAFLDQQFFSVPILLIVTGSLIFVIAFFGCCGAIRENYCMVMTFSVLLGVIFILEFAAGISGYVLKNQTHSFLAESLNRTLYEFNQTQYGYITMLWDEVQTKLECCGVNGPTDWIRAFNGTPMSCCQIPKGVFIEAFNCNDAIFAKGCLDSVVDIISAHAVSLGAAGLFIALFQLIGIFVTCFIARKIKNLPSAVPHNQFQN